MNKLYMYDNNTGIIIPNKLGTVPIEVLIADSVKGLHNLIENKSKLFCVFTHIPDADIIVPNEHEVSIVKKILELDSSDKEYVVIAKSSVSWYTDKVEKNIVISDSVKMDDKMFSSFFTIYLDMLKDINKGVSHVQEVKTQRTIRPDIYYVVNTRTNKINIKVPKLDDAKKICDQNPCLVVKDKTGKVIYKSKFGKVKLINKAKPKTINSLTTIDDRSSAKRTAVKISLR